jgi:aspartate racemase
MKTIGLIGGMSWESTVEYYKIINELVTEKLGGIHSAKIIMHSFDFQEIEELQHSGKWDELTDLLVEKAILLKNAGADFIVICTNTMHLMADDIEKRANIKVVHIAEATGDAIINKKMNKVALLGTKFTMQKDFYKKVLKDKYNIQTIIPNEEDMQIIHDIIYNELVIGKITHESKTKYINIIEKLAKDGAEGVVLGCTEIPLLIKQDDVSIPIFDTTEIHSKYCVEQALIQ